MSNINIKPYVDPKVFNLGLEKHKLSLFDGAKHKYSLSCLKRGDAWIYDTGLDESSPKVLGLEGDEKEAKIKQIRETVAKVERQLGGEILKSSDKDFWNKVDKLKSTNHSFWKTINLEIGNEPHPLDPGDPLDLLIISAIEAGGFPEVAPSFEIATTSGKGYKFYLDRLEQTVITDNKVKMLRDKAGAVLADLYENNINKLLYVCKVIDANSAQYKKSTPIGVLYNNMHTFIEGATEERNKKEACQKFIDTAKADMEGLKLRALVKDASWYSFLTVRGDGLIYDLDSGAAMGHNVAEVVEYLKNPIHEEILHRLLKKVEKYWNE